jgi:hypothetical protein
VDSVLELMTLEDMEFATAKYGTTILATLDRTLRIAGRN